MIPKPLNEIEWSDLEALKDSGREEDDTIEFKSSFSGGVDFLSCSDSQRATAVDGIAKEAIAFLNGRGGDIIIGASEFKNDHPRIEVLTPLENAGTIADRLSQSLAAIIEPMQSVLNVRAVKRCDSDSEGIVVVRVLSSLRAPHRSRRTKDCFVRRGRESVPMPMDEIQDLALQRNFIRSERGLQLEHLFEDFERGIVRRHRLSNDRFQIRLAYLPLSKSQIDLSDAKLRAIFESEPQILQDGRPVELENESRPSGMIWHPVLRGRAQTSENGTENGEFHGLIGREIRQNATVVFDGSWRGISRHSRPQEPVPFVNACWITDFIACALWHLRELGTLHPNTMPSILEARMLVSGPMRLAPEFNSVRTYELDEGLTRLESFEISSGDDFDLAFDQLQNDLFALVERKPQFVFALAARK